MEKTFESVCHKKTDCNGQRGCEHIIKQSFYSDGFHLVDIFHGDNSADDGAEHDGNNDKFYKVKKNRSDGSYIVYGDIRSSECEKNKTRDDSKSKGDKNLCGKGKFFSGVHKNPPFFKKFAMLF